MEYIDIDFNQLRATLTLCAGGHFNYANNIISATLIFESLFEFDQEEEEEEEEDVDNEEADPAPPSMGFYKPL